MEKEKGINLIVQFFSGEGLKEDSAGFTDSGKAGRHAFVKSGYQFEITDLCEAEESGVSIKRVISGRRVKGEITEKGVRFGFQIPLESGAESCWRFCVPSMVYTKPKRCMGHEKRTFMEDRLTDPMVLAYEADTGIYYHLSKGNPARLVEDAVREKGDSRYVQRTENISIGYVAEADNLICFESFWPYGEEDISSALSADERPAVAYYPLTGEDFEFTFIYHFSWGKNRSFAEAVYEAFEKDTLRMERMGEEVAELSFTPKESRDFRMKSLSESYREFEDGGAGFFFHFDPKFGYGSRPSGFSTCYETIPHNSYTHILEYGFTGRQINTAYIMAAERGGEWVERGERVIEFFLANCMTENGWLYSLYDLDAKAPFFSFGDPDAPKLHYISWTDKKGNYLRTMTEPMNDLLECFLWYRLKGREHENWKNAILKYADFLVKYQNADGSWYRAYCPDGEGTDTVDLQDGSKAESLREQKSTTAIPLVFLSNLCCFLRQEGKAYQDYYDSAVRAGDYVLKYMVGEEHYQGATLDNPNQVDKEASQYVMAGLCHLYALTKKECYLTGAENAAYIFMTWNYIWNAPMKKGTILYDKGFKTKGLGAINSVWGGGVVDIYSLFHIRELFEIGVWRKHPMMCRMAEWIAVASSQICSFPGDDMGFADIGMQPEGFGICPQGVDDGMIQKGGIWGTLGWIYSAGIYGLGNYLFKKEEMKNV